MADWVHCNKCYLQPNKANNIKFLLTNCGHIFCENCLKKSNNECDCCKKQCNTILLSANLNPDIQHFFTDVTVLLNKCLTVMDFQNNHRIKFFNHINQELNIIRQKYAKAKVHMKKQVEDFTKAKVYMKRQMEEIKTLRKENERLRQSIQTNSNRLHANQYSTPNLQTPLDSSSPFFTRDNNHTASFTGQSNSSSFLPNRDSASSRVSRGFHFNDTQDSSYNMRRLSLGPQQSGYFRN